MPTSFLWLFGLLAPVAAGFILGRLRGHRTLEDGSFFTSLKVWLLAPCVQFDYLLRTSLDNSVHPDLGVSAWFLCLFLFALGLTAVMPGLRFMVHYQGWSLRRTVLWLASGDGAVPLVLLSWYWDDSLLLAFASSWIFFSYGLIRPFLEEGSLRRCLGRVLCQPVFWLGILPWLAPVYFSLRAPLSTTLGLALPPDLTSIADLGLAISLLAVSYGVLGLVSWGLFASIIVRLPLMIWYTSLYRLVSRVLVTLGLSAVLFQDLPIFLISALAACCAPVLSRPTSGISSENFTIPETGKDGSTTGSPNHISTHAADVLWFFVGFTVILLL